jgi:hypothetical protein
MKILCLIKYPSHEDVWRVEVEIHEFLTSSLDGGEWLVSSLSRFNRKKISPDTHWIGGWVGHRVGIDAVAKRRSPFPCRESDPGRPTCGSVVILTDVPWHLLLW